MSELHGADPVSGVRNVPPAFPVKPVQPGPEERRSGQRRKNPPDKDSSRDQQKRKPNAEPKLDPDDDNSQSIDEYV